MTFPTGTVTFLFTDIEGSTQLWERFPEAMKAALARHDAILRAAIEAHHGHLVKTTGDGVHAVFAAALDAVQSVSDAQREMLAAFDDDMGPQIRIRAGLHTGEAELRDGDYFGQALNRAARIMSAGHGGQTLLSGASAEIVREGLVGLSLRDLGEHHLKGLTRPERIFQLDIQGLRSDFPALHTIEALTGNLPSQLTSFIGREREIDEATRLLATSRLLTLIGPGGTGKTRLSLQVAAGQAVRFRDGAWFVELAPVADPVNIVPTMATVFGLREVQNMSLLDVLLDYLRAKELLLVLDNCEHLVEASAQIVDRLLHACPALKVIASSREALGITGETVYRVPSLPEDEATRLFMDRAEKVGSRFERTPRNLAAITQICSRLDGIPLAIELAAARVKFFTPEQIAERLDDRFKLLTGGSRTALPRQQTLRALIDWSYVGLNEAEQRALRRLAVFLGGWTFEAAEEVIGESDALDSLLGLVNKSLVNVEEQEEGSRYRFLETIRQYALEKLFESGEAAEARDRHLEHFLHLAAESDQRMFGLEGKEWLDRMEAEHDNLRAAFEWATDNHIEKALQMALGVGGFWTSRDYYGEARACCHAILERTEGLPDLDIERSRVYALLAWTSITTGDHKTGRAAAEAGLALARQAGDTKSITRMLVVIGLAATFQGDFPAMQAALDEAESIARREGYYGELSLILTAKGQAIYMGTRDFALAHKYLDEATTLSVGAGFKWATSISAYGAGRLAGMLGDLDTARAKLTESARISSEFGNQRLVYSSRSELAHILREQGQLDEAFNTYMELLPAWVELGHRAALAHELECMAYILVKREQPERAATLFGAAEALREVIDTTMTTIEREEYDKEVSALHAGMDKAEFDECWARGRAMSMDEAIAFALGGK